jgi:hypothetical protein
VKKPKVAENIPDEECKNHFPSDFVRGNYRKYLLPFAIYLFIALIVFWPVTLKITSTVAAGGPDFVTAGSGDVYQNLWSLWWASYAVFNRHTSPYFTNLLFYPNGANLVTETLSPLAGIFSYIFQSISLGFAYNVVFFLGFVLSAFFMFLLADYIIKNKYGALIAGVVFAYSSFHMSHALAGHLQWTSIEFIPLFILFLLLMIKDKKLFSIFGTSVSFLLLVFFGDPEQGVITLIFVFALLIAKLSSQNGRKEIINRKFAMAALSALVITLIIGSPFFIPIANGIRHGALNLSSESSTLGSTIEWSDPLASFFLPSPYNNLFSTVSGSYASIYISGIDSRERISYIGYTVMILAFVAIIEGIRKHKIRDLLLWLILGVVFALFSVGPYLLVGGVPSQLNVKNLLPGIYLLYKNIPLLNIAREPSRFDVIVTLCTAILAGFGFRAVAERMSISTIHKDNMYSVNYLALFVIVLIVVECAGIPLTSSYIRDYYLNLAIPNGYYQIARVPGTFSVMILPILISVTGKPELYVGMSMYYQTAFERPIIGGYTTRENITDDYPRLNIPLSVEAASLQAGGLFAYVSPINENYSNLTLFFLSKYDTKFVSVINSAYNFTDTLILYDYLNSLFGSPIYTNNATSIWSVNNTVQNARNKSIVSYISQGNWTFGCSGLGPVFCNASQDTLWYGPNVRAINVSVPKNKTKLLMRFSAASLNDNVTLYLFLTSDKHELGAAKLSHNIVNYELNLTLNPGTSAIFFVAQNLTTATVNQTFDFGIRNITFQPISNA